MLESQESINKVRELVLKDVSENPEDFDEIDVTRVRNDDAYIYRFIEDRYGKVSDAAKMLLEALRWRKAQGINHLTDQDIPAELFWASELFQFHKDKNNIPTLYLRVDRHRPLPPAMKEISKRFIIYMLEKAEKIASENGTGIGLILDARGGKIYHVEIDLDFFALKIITSYYPGCLEYLVIFEIPWVLMAILKLIKAWCPPHYQEKFKFLDKSAADHFIGIENFPSFMGGKNPVLYPKECFSSPTVLEFEKVGKLPEGSSIKTHKIYAFAFEEFYQSEEYKQWKQEKEKEETATKTVINKTINNAVAAAAEVY